jgi:hypothetical protein
MGDIVYGIFVIVVLAGVVFVALTIEKGKKRQLAAMSTEERQSLSDTNAYGLLNPVMVCPHCQTQGRVHSKAVILKKGVSGGKAAAAVLTAGVSVLATGLSRKESATRAWCGTCKNSWIF